MNVKELVGQLDATCVTNESGHLNKIEGGFVGDLLSVVMGKAQAGDAWITIMSHFNIVAVASLVDVACIIVTEGFKVDDDAIEKANEEGIPILQTQMSSFEVAKKLTQLGV